MNIDLVTPQLLFFFFGNLSLSGIYKLEETSRMTSKHLLLWVRKLRPRKGKWLGLLRFPLPMGSRITKVLEARIVSCDAKNREASPSPLLSDLSLSHRHERSLRPLQVLPPNSSQSPHKY